MKKKLFYVLMIVCGLSLAGCGKKDSSEKSVSDNITEVSDNLPTVSSEDLPNAPAPATTDMDAESSLVYDKESDPNYAPVEESELETAVDSDFCDMPAMYITNRDLLFKLIPSEAYGLVNDLTADFVNRIECPDTKEITIIPETLISNDTDVTFEASLDAYPDTTIEVNFNFADGKFHFSEIKVY